MGNSVGNWEGTGKGGQLTAGGKAPIEEEGSRSRPRNAHVNYKVEQDKHLYYQGTLSCKD